MTQYIEGYDPGFKEYSPEDFAVEEETAERQELRMQLLRSIEEQFDRLGLDAEAKSYLAHYHGLGADPMTSPMLELRLFLDWLKQLDAISSEERQ